MHRYRTLRCLASHKCHYPLQTSRKFEQTETEAALLRMGAKDPKGQKDFEKELSVKARRPSGSQPPSKTATSLAAAVHAKPFVPKGSNGGDQVQLQCI